MRLCTSKEQFWLYRSFSKHSAQAADQLNWNQYLGVSHLSGIPFSFPIILLSEIIQPYYVHVNTCNNVQIVHPNANSNETRYFAWSISVLANDGILLSDFLISNDVFGGTLWVRLNIEISKSALLLANEHWRNQKKMLQMIFVWFFAMCSFTQKRLCQWNARKCSIKEGFNQNGSLSIS